MLPKYTVEYVTPRRLGAQSAHYGTDDPVACEESLVELLDQGYRIKCIKHEGVPLGLKDFDQLIRRAAAALAAGRICASLAITPEEEKFRFGFAA